MNNLLFMVTALGLLFVAVPAFAQETDKVKELQRLIDAQQLQLEAQQQQLEIQMQMLIQLQSEVERSAKSEDKEGATPGQADAPEQSPSASTAAEVPPQPAPASVEDEASTSTIESPEPRQPTNPGLAQTDRLDSQSPTSVDVTYIDPTAIINIPGKNTSVGLHGFVQFQIMHDTSGPAGNQFNTAEIPVDGAPSETKFSVNPSRLAFSSVTQVPDGQLNTLISMDFYGAIDRPEPRLRLAYGEFVNESRGFGILGGQSFATMADLRAVPETVDFAIPAGSWAQRQAMLRFTKSFGDGFLMETSLETPANVRYIDAEKRTRLPDFVLAGTWILNGRSLRHLRLNVLARDLEAQAANGATDSALGWAVSASTKVDLPYLGKRDNFKLTVHHGDAYGTQLKGGPAEAVFNTATSELDTIGISSWFGGIQHFWSDKYRSNLTYGYVNADNPASVPNDALDSTTYASINFIWNPYKQLTLGAEYLWGQRKNADGASGTSNRYLLSSRLDF